jgi:hypothetical protein
MLKECLHAEIRERRPEENRRKPSFRDLLLIELRGGSVEKLHLLPKLLRLVLRDELSEVLVVKADLLDFALLRALLCVVENEDLLRRPVINSLEGLS